MDITAKLVENFVKGYNISASSSLREEENLSQQIDQMFTSRNGTLTNKQLVGVANTQVASVFPETRSVTDELVRTYDDGNGSGPGIQALIGTIGVIICIFLVGVANGMRDKKRQKPKPK